jgi:hypothetical protein
MDIIIEIGTQEQKLIIEEELRLITNAFETKIGYSPLSKILVPSDFDAAINQILASSTYKSVRENHIALAKTLKTQYGIVIVLSSTIYGFENLIRINTIIHELFHCYNPNFHKEFDYSNPSEYRYKFNLYHLFDEYQAVRGSYTTICQMFQPMPFYYLRNTITTFLSHINSIVDKSIYYNKMKDEIIKFRFTADINNFLQNIDPIFKQVIMDIIYIYAIYDCTVYFRKYDNIIKSSPFINNNSDGLINFYRDKYNKRNYDLDDGYDLMVEMTKNFGMEFWEVEGGEYCKVLNI